MRRGEDACGARIRIRRGSSAGVILGRMHGRRSRLRGSSAGVMLAQLQGGAGRGVGVGAGAGAGRERERERRGLMGARATGMRAPHEEE